jgi:hypothetical protein
VRSLAELDTTTLTPEARDVLRAVQRIENEGEPLELVLAELGIDEAEYNARVYKLAQEWRQQGAPIEIPPLSSEEYIALRDSIAATGQQYPILRAPEHDGWLVDGEHRDRACRELGIEPTYRDVFGTRDELESLALVLNLARRQLSTGARRGIVQAEVLRDPTRSDRAIAATVGVSHPTVASVRRELEQSGQVERLSTSVGVDGKTYPKRATEPRPAGEFELPDGVVDVTLRVDRQIAAELEAGGWLNCKAVRLVLVDPCVYTLEVQT